MEVDPTDRTLAMELGEARRRRERLRLDREKTEKLLMEKGRILEEAVREMEDRWEAQLKMEAELRYLIRLRELGPSSSSISPSLRSSLRNSASRLALLGEESEDPMPGSAV